MRECQNCVWKRQAKHPGGREPQRILCEHGVISRSLTDLEHHVVPQDLSSRVTAEQVVNQTWGEALDLQVSSNPTLQPNIMTIIMLLYVTHKT